MVIRGNNTVKGGQQKMTSILIADPIPLLNKGEQALLEGIVESLNIIFNKPDIMLLSNYPAEDEGRSSIPVIDRNLVLFKSIKKLLPRFAFLMEGALMAILSRFGRYVFRRFFTRSKLWQAFLNSDIIVVGHDSTVSYDAIIIGWLLNKPLVIFAGSIELFRNRLKERIAKVLLKKVNLITLREDDSYKALLDLGVIPRVKTQVTADVAFLLKPCSPERVKELIQQESLPTQDRPKVGVTLTRQMCERSHQEISDVNERYKKAIAEKAIVLDEVIERYNVKIIFFPHCIGPGKNDDRLVARDVIQLMKRKDMAKPIVSDLGASELKGLIGQQCEVFIGERTHSVIAAMSQGIPSICITFPSDRRTHGIIGGMICQRDFIYNVERLNPIELLSLVDKLWSERPMIRKKLEDIMPLVKERALNSARLIQTLVSKKEKPANVYQYSSSQH